MMSLVPTPWELWLLVGLVLGGAELHFGHYVLLAFGLGAWAAALAAGLGASFNLQVVTFILASCALVASSRTLFRRFLFPVSRGLPEGADALLGAEAVVVEPLSETAGTVRLHGTLWAARTLAGAIPPGERVRVERVEGLTLYVRRQEVPVWQALSTKGT